MKKGYGSATTYKRRASWSVFPFVFTIFFMLLGPVKIIHAFAGLTQGTDLRFKRAVAIRGALIASALCAFVVLAGSTLLGKYRIQMDAVRIAGGVSR